MTMLKSRYQACIGPDMRCMHLRDTLTTRPMNGDLVLCGGTAIFADYRGLLIPSKSCKKCMGMLYRLKGNVSLKPEDIGIKGFV
jgi:hypothetical protein